MPTVDTSHIDLERGGGGGHRRSSSAASDTISDVGSCYSRFYDEHSFDCGSDLENGGVSDCSEDETKVHLEKVERDCRICHLNLESSNSETGVAIELGCSCKDDLAAAHKNCAEAWFKIKGNKTCEICNSVARNVLNASEIELIQQTNEANVTSTNAVSAPNPPTAETRRCLNGHRLVNLLLACMVCAFVISWLFHFNIPS
ncbi:uncharacterized protein LOC131326591 [Rhododendron vialii]|uniref:uncharacterized protein LOC131326591 n=1 Tax=Rhododendron vialii TaxID=182163 RepID=UPI00265E8130|nr:uncharacterized protein LOC131326591 [Rhododendron vialii]